MTTSNELRAAYAELYASKRNLEITSRVLENRHAFDGKDWDEVMALLKSGKAGSVLDFVIDSLKRKP